MVVKQCFDIIWTILICFFLLCVFTSDLQAETPKPVLPGHPEEDSDREGDRGDVQHHEVGDEEYFHPKNLIFSATHSE